MPTPQELQEENERLKACITAYEAKEIVLLKTQRSFWKQLLLNITAPSRIKNLALILLLMILGYYCKSIEMGWATLRFLLGIAFLLIIGYYLGQRTLKQQQKKLQQKLKQQEFKINNKQLINTFLALFNTRFSHQKKVDLLSPYVPLLHHALNWGTALGSRILAWSSLMGVLALVVSFAIAIATFEQVQLLAVQNEKIEHQNKRLDQQIQLQEAERRGALVFMLGNTLEAINRELKDDYKKDNIRNLSPQLIGQIIALSNSFKPYRYLENDTLIHKLLSPERGQLLVSLVESQLDSVTYRNIIPKANFNQADLRGAFLSKLDLRSANLEGANLRKANLSMTNLSGAYLIGADLKGVNLSVADLSSTHFNNADLTNAFFMNAHLERTYLNGANLNHADFRDAYVLSADFRNANTTEIILHDKQLGGIVIGGIRVTSHNFVDQSDASSKYYFQQNYYIDSTAIYEEVDTSQQSPYYLIKRKE